MIFSHLYSAIMRGTWFLDFRSLEAHSVLIDQIITGEGLTINSEKLSDREPLVLRCMAADAEDASQEDPSAKQSKVAIVPLHGTMMKYGTMCSYGTTELAELIYQAAKSSDVSGLILDIDSGGGAVDAIAPLTEAIHFAQSKGKSVVAHCDLAASAAYYVATACDEIIAANDLSAEFGSIGVMMSFPDYAKYYEKNGVKIHTIYSNLSNYKNAAFELAKTGEYDKIKEEALDPLARKFQDAVKESRGTKLDTKVPGILNGQVFYAKDALKHGLIDSIGGKEEALGRVRELSASALVTRYMSLK